MKTLLKFFGKIIYWAVMLFLIVYSILFSIANIFPFNDVVFFFSKILNFDPNDYFAVEANAEISTDTLNNIFLASYDVFFILSFISAVAGVILLSRGRKIHEILALFIAYILPRQRRYWGRVTDASNGKNIPFSVIRLYEITGDKEVLLKQAIADLDGRYKISLSKRSERVLVRIQADGYITFEKEFDQIHEVAGEYVFAEDISLARKDKEQNSLVKLFNYHKPKLYAFVLNYILLISVLSLLFSIYGVLAYGAFDNWAYLLLYLFAVVWNIFVIFDRSSIKKGRLLSKSNNAPIAGATLSLFDGERKVATVMSDTNGNVTFSNVNPGNYTLLVDKTGFIKPESTLEVKLNKGGSSAKNVYLEPSNVEDTHQTEVTSEPALGNPFA